ncbi:MAG TPA: hypothetical protein VJL89_06275 [Thermodesulfovibrionia bacterium]|nr:hypothetical protein [Thermodesulfovibrionia bacterium]
MGKKRYKKQIRGLQKQIAIHERKIDLERTQYMPDEGMIRHWQQEIKTFQNNIDKIIRRFNK